MNHPIDLHCHSTASDGTLSPTDVVTLSHELGVRTLALTDHDCTDGIAEAQQAAATYGLHLVAGAEVSVTWQRKVLHIVALDIDIDQPDLRQLLNSSAQGRLTRAREIGRRLAKLGIEGAFDGAATLAGDGMITRTHFARFLVETGASPDMDTVFKRWLGRGKPACVQAEWPDLEVAVDCITKAGGAAVLAHPASYGLTGAWMRRLLPAFREAGGVAMEVVTGNSAPHTIEAMGTLARRFDLAGSVGSDFHTPDNQWVRPGRLRPLPRGVTPVWDVMPRLAG